MPSEKISEHILQRAGVPDLLKLLDSFSASELNSLLLEVQKQTAGKITPPRLLKNYQKNRFSRLSLRWEAARLSDA